MPKTARSLGSAASNKKIYKPEPALPKTIKAIGPPYRPARRLPSGAQAHPKYYDRHEEYVLVTRDDLREISSIGWLQEGAAGIGLFFFSGAFWLLLTLIAEHGRNAEFYSWYFVCVIIVICGAAVMSVGVLLYSARQRRLKKYFPKEPDEANTP
jgi:hypothetical protein